MVKEKSNNPAIDQAVLTVKKLSAEEEMKLEALAREKAYRDSLMYLNDSRAKGLAEGLAEGINKGLAEGIAKGRAEGIAEGRAEERVAIASNLRAMGLSEEQIEIALNGKEVK